MNITREYTTSLFIYYAYAYQYAHTTVWNFHSSIHTVYESMYAYAYTSDSIYIYMDIIKYIIINN